MKTSELIGHVLDWAVAKAQGWTDYPNDSIEQGGKWHCDPEKTPFGRVMWKDHFTPSTDWSQGGPIIERECIALKALAAEPVYWRAGTFGTSIGPTPLIAAMRCYVASKFGDEIDIPKELM